MKSVTTCLFILILTFLFSCNRNKYNVNIENISLPLEFINLDSILYTTHGGALLKKKNEFLKKDADLFNYNLEYCYHIKTSSDTAFQNGIFLFFQDKYIQRLEKTIA